MITDALNSIERIVFDRIAGAEGTGVQPGTPEYLQLVEDRRRLQAIQALRAQLADPGRAQAIDNARITAEAAGLQSAQDAYSEASGQVRASAAGRGLLGSSRTRVAQAGALAALEQARAGVVADTMDQAEGIRRGDEARALEQLDGVLAPTGTNDASLAAVLAGNRAQGQARILADEVGSRSRAALSQAIGGFLGNTGSAYVGASFDRADRIDRANDMKWLDRDKKDEFGNTTARPSLTAPTSSWSSLWKSSPWK